ncbi:MAG: DUF2007 domain-containing protein [Bacteroidia bacterium]|nr:DUF2007 domain-containing protein [Bacteroidia bacterium]MCC7534366.1 DUF2007 domain-containing protein [Bacteroidia bacterium]MCZ2140426.1 DUF2007 domain-containing protein [Bacteroidia bacterium]
MANDFSKICDTNNLIEAELIKQLLFENGIDATVLNKRDSSYQAFGVIEIYCHTNQLLQAIQLIKNNSINEE